MHIFIWVPATTAHQRESRPLVAGVDISHPDRMVFPVARATKLDLARYYETAADSLPALVGLVQMGVLEIHTWNSRFARVEQPDRIVVDLDPGEGIEWPAVIGAARLVREVLDVLKLASFVKTHGGVGHSNGCKLTSCALQPSL